MQISIMNDEELARRSIVGFGEVIAAIGRGSGGIEAEVRRPDAVGAHIQVAADNPWFDAAVVPPGATPPNDGPRLPRCLWTLGDAVPGRTEELEIATPCMGVALDDPRLVLGAGASCVEMVPLDILGDINERAYGDTGWFSPLIRTLCDDRVRTHGLRDGGVFVSVALTFAVGDDLGIHYVATEATHRRRGLASRLVLAVMATARAEGMRSATLQASADGLPVWTRLGFRHVGTMRGYLRTDISV